MLPKRSKEDFLAVLGDVEDAKYPIFMTGEVSQTFLIRLDGEVYPQIQMPIAGPVHCTLCTTLVDLDQRTVCILQGNPKNGKFSHVFSMLTEELEIIP